MYARIERNESDEALKPHEPREHRELSEIRAALEAQDPGGWIEAPDAVVEENFAELHRIGELAEAAKLRLLPHIERRRLHERDGHLSVASWLVNRFQMAWGTARDYVRMARGLEHMPETRRALEEGQISLSGASVLTSARQVSPQAFSAAEPQLVQTARIHTVQDLRRATAYWTQAVEVARAGDPEEKLRARRRLHASPTYSGMVRVDGDLDPETGENLITALRAVCDAEARSGHGEGDERTPAQRRADALGEICRGWLDLAPRASVAGERPHVSVTVDASVLAGAGIATSGVPTGDDVADSPGSLVRATPALAGSPLPGTGTPTTPACELDHTGPVNPEVARRLACDSSLMRVVMAGASEPLDVGRRTPVVSPAIRRAVITRDRGCRFPGCGRPHGWCDAHHVTHWADGGPTAVGNLVLLCRRHHRMIHDRGGFSLALENGRAVFRRPDGSVLEDRTPRDRAPP